MNKNKLGKSSFMVSKIGLGTVQFGLDYGFTKKKSQDEVNELLYYADKYEVNLIDTARSYGDSEEKIGNYISQNKNRLIIATKLEKIMPEDAKNKERLKTKIMNSIEASLKNLRLSSIHALQLHQTDSFLVNNNDFWEILISLKEEGLIKALGVSVYEEAETINLVEDYGDYIDFFQVPYNIFDRRFESLEKLLEKNQIGVISRSAFLKGVITCDINSLPHELEGLKNYKNELEKISNRLSMKVSEAALLYVCGRQFINSTILGVDSVSELKQNINSLVKVELIIKNYWLFDDLKVNEPGLIDPRKWTSL